MSKRILIEIGHPNDVHQFKYLYGELRNIGWEVLFMAKKKDIVLELLNAYQLPYKVFAKTPQSIAGKLITLPIFDVKYLLKASLFNDPNRCKNKNRKLHLVLSEIIW